MQSQLDAAAQRGPVVERERRHPELAETPEHRVSGPSDGQALLSPAHGRDGREIGADGEDGRLARDAHTDDVVLRDAVQRGVQSGQAGEAEGVRPGTVEAVVQRDESEAADPEGQVDIADDGLGDNLRDTPGGVPAQLDVLRHRPSAVPRRGKSVAGRSSGGR